MKAFSIARKTLLEYWREPLLLGLLFAFPILLIGFYYVAFGRTDQGLASYLTISAVNQDAGSETWQAGDELIAAIQATTWEGKPVFAVTVVPDLHAAEITVRERKAALLLTIPPDFSTALLAPASGTPPATITLLGDPASDNFVFAQTFLDDLVHAFVQQAAGPAAQLAAVNWEFVPGTGSMSDFEFGVPGMIVFGIMFMAVSTAMTLVREQVGGTLPRLRLTRAGAFDLLLGVTLAQMALALLMVPAVFGSAMAFGFRGNGSLLLGAGIGLLLSLAAVGIGLLTACFARNDGEAANLSSVIGVLMVVLSGAMYPMPAAPIATVAGRTIQIYDLLPTTHAGEAMRRVLVLGDGLNAIGYELALLAVLSALTLAAGVILYQRLQMRPR